MKKSLQLPIKRWLLIKKGNSIRQVLKRFKGTDYMQDLIQDMEDFESDFDIDSNFEIESGIAGEMSAFDLAEEEQFDLEQMQIKIEQEQVEYSKNIEQTVDVPNVDNFLLILEKLKDLLLDIEDPNIKETAYTLYSKLNNIYFSDRIDDILQDESKNLSFSQMALKKYMESNIDFFKIIITSLLLQNDYKLVIKVFKLIRYIGYTGFPFILNFLRHISLYFRQKNLDDFEELMEYMCEEYFWDSVYGIQLYLLVLYQTELSFTSIFQNFQRQKTFEKFIKNLNKIYEVETTVLKEFKENFNFFDPGPDFCLSSALECPHFRKRWNSRKWFFYPKYLDFDPDLSPIVSEELLIINEINHFNSNFESAISHVQSFNFQNQFCENVVSASLEGKNHDEIMQNCRLLNLYFKLLNYSGLGIYYKLAVNPEYYKRSQIDFQNIFMNKLVSESDYHNFVLENLYFFHFLFTIEDFFQISDEKILLLLKSLIRAPFEMMNFFDQNILLLSIVRLLRFIEKIEDPIDLKLTRKHVLNFLLLQEKIYSLFQDRYIYVVILSHFPHDEEIYEKIIQNLPSEMDPLQMIVQKFTVNRFYLKYTINQNLNYMVNCNIVYKMIELNGYSDKIVDIHLKKIQSYLNLYSLGKTFDLDDLEIMDIFYYTKIEDYNSIDDESIKKFGEEVAPYYKKSPQSVQRNALLCSLILNEEFRKILEQKLNFE